MIKNKSKLARKATASWKIILLLPLIFNSAQLLAENADRDKPINIEADSAHMNDKTSTAVFKGNVVLTQGTLLIRADTLTVIQENDEFKQGIALGELAYFRQKREGYDDYIEGEAKTIEFNAITDQLTMVDTAKLWREGDQVEGKFIHYDATTETFTVRSDAGNPDSGNPSNGRVKATIQPKQQIEP
jgi:lipopolysaccharide export system protein LptA